jgi:hypothetical protein
MLDAVAVSTKLEPVHTEVPVDAKTTPGEDTVNVMVLEAAIGDVKQVPPLMLMLHLIVFPLVSVVLV